jgi:hypothetical protein
MAAPPARSGDQAEVDVVDNHLRAVLGSSFLSVDVVEPLVVAGDEVAPLQDLQRLGRASRRNVEEWSGGRGCTHSGLDDIAARQAVTTRCMG